MLNLSDPRWATMLGGYRLPYDPRHALADLEEGRNIEGALEELWDRLYHQGDVGEASYAAVPHLVRIHSSTGIPEWHAYALAATIEEARVAGKNPELPPHLREGYLAALRQLVDIGLVELKSTDNPVMINSIVSLVAFAKGQVTLGQMALLTEDERREMLDRCESD